MLTEMLRLIGWSGLDTERELCSARAESACWAAAMVAETWSAAEPAVVVADGAIWRLAMAAAVSVLSERTDIVPVFVVGWSEAESLSSFTFVCCCMTYLRAARKR